MEVQNSTCRACQAPIKWIKDGNTGRNTPINVNAFKMYVRTKKGWFVASCHESHFATCPEADSFRKNRRDKGTGN